MTNQSVQRFHASDLADAGRRRVVAERFRAEGVVAIAQAVAPGELAALRRDAAAVLAAGAGRAGEADWFVDGGALHRVQYVFDKGRALLAAAANPALLALVRELLGDDVLCAGEALVLKSAGAGRAVPVHADCDPASPALARDHLFFNLGLYLDDASEANGCLLAAPGSHRRGESGSAIAALGFAYPGLRPVPARAGDVVVHDTRLAHGSRATDRGRARRTLYYEFHDRAAIARDGYPPGRPLPPGWCQNRQRVLHRAIALRARLPWAAHETPFAYRPATPPPGADDLVDLRPRLGWSNYV